MQRFQAEPISPRRHILAEGPCYRRDTGILSWVDIKAGALHLRERDGSLGQVQVGQYLGAAIPARSGRYVGMMATGVYLFNREGLVRKVCQPEDMALNHRFNDAKCDPRGRLWGGVMTISTRRPPELGQLYRFTPQGKAETVLTGLGIPNGMAWSADGRTMYFINTPSGGVDAMDYDPDTGAVGNRRRVVSVTGGGPDGMTIDAEDRLWVAVWGGSQVRRYDPQSGEQLAAVDVPARAVSSCCFGGEDLQTLYITTSGEPEPDNPMAGCVFAVRVPVTGTETVLCDDSGF